ncbi:MAG: NUDIX hydrolase [Alphaproteobacteria bacterium]
MASRQYPDRPFVGVGVVVLKDDAVLLIRRGKPPRLGEWSLPGGAQRLGETVEEAALREVREETGISLALMGLIDVVDSISHDDEGRVRYHYTLVDLAARWTGGSVVPGGDAAHAAWVPLERIETLGLWSETVRVIRLAAARLSRTGRAG